MQMKVEDLRRYGVAETLVTQWRNRLGDYLLPVQEKAVRHGLLDNRSSTSGSSRRLLISSPTGSGKSFCAEMAAAVALSQRRKTVMLFPLKSLAEQKYRDWCDLYGSTGIDVLIVTADHPENDRRFLSGDYDIALAIYEKFDQLLTVRLDMLAVIGLVVIDEIQTIGQAPRGAVLERLLTKLLSAVYNPSLVALSAVIGDAAGGGGRLADWLGATLIEERRRPVELRRGVLVNGTYHFQTFNDAVEGEERLGTADAADDRVASFISQIRGQDGQTLVFLKSRRDTIEAAHALASKVAWPPADQAIAALDATEESSLKRALLTVLSRGVAFHNADLTSEQRRVIEEAFIAHEVRVLFSTTTLAMGVNLSADTVFLETVRYAGSEYGGRPSLVPLSKSEYDNMTGRAGRPGGSNGTSHFGRAVVLAESDFEEEVLWRNYIDGHLVDDVRSVLDSMPLEDWCLNILASGLAADEPALQDVFASSLYATTHADREWPSFSAALNHLRNRRLIAVDPFSPHRIQVTPLGRAAASVGLTAAAVERYRVALDAHRPESLFGWIMLVLLGDNLPLPPGLVKQAEVRQPDVWRQIYQFDAVPAGEVEALLGRETVRAGRLEYGQLGAIKGALLLVRWAALTPAMQLERQFGVHLGQISGFAGAVGHRLYGVGRLLEADGSGATVREELSVMARSVRRGVPAELHELLEMRLERSEIAALAAAGLTDYSAIVESDKEHLAAVLKNRARAEQVWQTFDSEDETMAQMQQAQQMSLAERPVLHGGRPQAIEVEGSPDRERFVVTIDGFRVCLTGKSFKYFVKLAWARRFSQSGWLYKEDLEVGFNQARYLYRMKTEIGSQLRNRWSMVENNRLGYYRLNVDPSAIRINIEQLREHPDWEIRSLVGEHADKAVN